MKTTPWLFGSLAVIALAACSGNKRNDTGSAGGAETESGTMQNDATSRADTGMAGMDTSTGATGRMSSDTSAGASAGTGTAGTGSKANQTKSGVTNTKTGQSTLGKGVTKTRPDQGQPVTSKGDTVANSPDSGTSNR